MLRICVNINVLPSPRCLERLQAKEGSIVRSGRREGLYTPLYIEGEGEGRRLKTGKIWDQAKGRREMKRIERN